MGLGGLEPPTSRLSGVRSNHLSYSPISLGASLYDIKTSVSIALIKKKSLFLCSNKKNEILRSRF